VFDGKDTERYLYQLDLEKKQLKRVYRKPLSATVPIALSRNDKYLYTALPHADTSRVVRLCLADGENAEPETIYSFNSPILSVEVDDQERVYVVPSPQSRELLKITPEGGKPRRLGSILRNAAEYQPVELSDGRVVRPGRVLGRDRLSLSRP